MTQDEAIKKIYASGKTPFELAKLYLELGEQADKLAATGSNAAFWFANSVGEDGFISQELREKHVAALEEFENTIASYNQWKKDSA